MMTSPNEMNKKNIKREPKTPANKKCEEIWGALVFTLAPNQNAHDRMDEEKVHEPLNYCEL
jgi:hypothetical protein